LVLISAWVITKGEVVGLGGNQIMLSANCFYLLCFIRGIVSDSSRPLLERWDIPSDLEKCLLSCLFLLKCSLKVVFPLVSWSNNFELGRVLLFWIQFVIKFETMLKSLLSFLRHLNIGLPIWYLASCVLVLIVNKPILFAQTSSIFRLVLADSFPFRWKILQVLLPWDLQFLSR